MADKKSTIFCVDCAHCRWVPLSGGYMCNRVASLVPNKITGTPEMTGQHRCWDERESDLPTLCGQDGRHFKPRPPEASPEPSAISKFIARAIKTVRDISMGK